MSEPKLISPLLSDHLMGDPISNHHGICCCPAIKKETEDKYIVKILSIPASQVQLDAFLLTGAYTTKEDALAYFKELADATVQEAEILKKLSEIEGFCSYEGWQIVPMEDAVGYDVYLLGAYRPTLEWFFKSNPMTHLAAVNLGLDLCAALSACRRNGYLYVDLKPGNVFITGNHEYRIGDLGFVQLDSLKYASLPDKYRSAYTAPEIQDAYSSLNPTVDIYAVGLILYQAYNGGLLPAMSSDEPLPPPAYADYEMAQIILKACAEDPVDRWQDPAEMGQELVAYMQRNSVNDVPIIPAPIEEPPSEEIEETAEETEVAEEDVSETAEESAEEDVSETAEESAEEAVEEQAQKETYTEEAADDTPSEEEIPAEETEAEAEESLEEEQFVIEGFEIDETAPTEEDLPDLEDAAVSDETSAMLAQADELIAHEIPEPVVAPEPVEITLPEPVVPDQATEENPEEEAGESEDENAATEPEESANDALASSEETQQEQTPAKHHKKHNTLVTVLSTILILLLLAVGVFYLYENYYIQLIQNVTVTSKGGQMTVVLDTQVDNELLTVICQDTYGNKQTTYVSENTATFSGITSNTHYKITVEVSGFHRLIGTTTANHTTDAQTNIVSFTGITGDQAGSVVLNFSVQGEDNFGWRIYYSTPGEEEKSVECNGHMATVTGLTVGSTYTFRLAPVVDLQVAGTDTFTYTATDLIYPEGLAIKGFKDGVLQAAWKAPMGVTVNSWTVRCYNSEGFNESYTVTEPMISIKDLDPKQSYTIDVKAENMTVSKWVSLTANSVTFTDIKLDNSNPDELKVTWRYEGTAPKDGWRLLYTVDGGQKQVILCEGDSCTISPLVPGGKYAIAFELPADVTVFGGKANFEAPKSNSFSNYGVSSKNFHFRMCRTPDRADWRWYNLYEKDFTTKFKVGEKASFIFNLDKDYKESPDEIETLFVVRDADKKVISINPGRTRIWGAMWNERYSELDVPAMPQEPGEYSVDIYFNGTHLTTQNFTVIK